MKITNLIAAAALATVSTAAVADVTTASGDLVIIEKNQSIDPTLILVGGTFVAFLAIATSGTTSATTTGGS